MYFISNTLTAPSDWIDYVYREVNYDKYISQIVDGRIGDRPFAFYIRLFKF